MRKLIMTAFCLLAALCCTLTVSAEEVREAADITEETTVSATGYGSVRFLTDKNTGIYAASQGNASVTLENAEGIGSLYLLFDLEYGQYTVTNNTTGQTMTAGTYDFIHEFIDLEAAFGAAPASVTLDFANGTVILSEIYVFSSGEVPDFVQKWEPPLDGCADILMLPTHGDDDQLYFAGLLPYYAGELDCAVQVAYLTNHRNDTNVRFHEILNGLWATGVENYPVFGFKWDFRIDDLNESYRIYTNYGVSREDLEGFAVELLRRFKPLVAVGHDVFGEYGHGMHRVYADILMKAADTAADPTVYPESAQQYGVWDVPKTYLHLLEENPIVIDYDIPLDSYGGLTAFQVTQKYGFPCHVSQHIYNAFSEWLYGLEGEITKASQIVKYSPCNFGLYRSTVGEDVLKNDFLENVTTYAEQARLEQERLEQERLEQERLERERLEKERLEQERLEQERLEQERLQQEEQARQESIAQEELEREAERIQRENRWILLGLVAVLLVSFSIGSRIANKVTKREHDLGGQKKLKK